MNVKEFLAKQLNDHSQSPSGVVQRTFYEWTEQHVTDAIYLALSYLYSLLPNEFSDLTTVKTSNEDCVFDFCSVCEKFLSIVDVEIDGVSCISTIRLDSETNSLVGLLAMGCETEKDINESGFLWDVVDGSNCVVKFDRAVPKGANVRFLCATAPMNADALDDNRLSQYLPLIADYALWWLFRTDSESRSNLDRARLHFEGVRDFVTTKLLLEFSIQEDDYKFGRRSVDD